MDLLDLLFSNLTKRGFIPHYAATAEEAVAAALKLIPGGSFVSFGGSMTVNEIGLHKALNCDDRIVKHRDYPDNMAKRYDGNGDKWFISSTNAMTVGGELINIDGSGNRVSGMLHNNPNVLVVTGVNKIVESIDEGINRVRNVAAPPNAVRLGRKTPCAVTGKCSDCYTPDCMCNATVIQHHPMKNEIFHIIIVNETLGY